MIISAHQPAYNPWLGYFHKILLSDVFVIMDDVQFEKNSFINRNKVYQKHSGLMLTIPCSTKNYKEKTIKEINIANHMWKKKHIKTLKQIYSNTPFYVPIMEIINKSLCQSSDLLVDYTNTLLLAIVDYLNIKTKIIFASELNLKNKKLDYVIELTKSLNGDIFIFGKLGEYYADLELLSQNKIKAYFQDYLHPEYTQNNNVFIPNLGILDLCFNVDKKYILDIIFQNNITKKQLEALYV